MTHAEPDSIRNPPGPSARRPPGWLMALGRGDLPDELRAAGVAFRRVQTFKHDFFAATGLYQAADGRKVVLKIGRRAWLGPFPMKWAGRYLCNREVRLYRHVEGIAGIPRLVDRWAETGFLHEYVEGRPLGRHDRIDDEFFPRLRDMIAAIHARDAAYVDLEKRENILLGDDGRPWLIDFQISWHWPGLLGRWPPLSWIRRALQSADHYHLLKHWRRLRPDQIDADQAAASRRPPLWIAWHRVLFRPFTRLRRMVLVRLGARESSRTRSPG